MRRAAVEPQAVPGVQRHGLPVELLGDRRLDAPALVEGEHAVEAARDDFEAAIGRVGVVNCQHRGKVDVDHGVRRSVLVRATPAGRRVFAAVTPKLQEFHRRQWSGLSASEVDTLHDLLAKALWGDAA